jgi:hypothetical protein
LKTSKKNRKTRKEPSQNDGEAIDLSKVGQGPDSCILIIGKTSEGGRGRCGRAKGVRGTNRRGGGGIRAPWVLSSARVGSAAFILTAGVGLRAGIDALVVLFGANVVGYSLGILGSVGRLAVVADTVISKGILCAQAAVRKRHGKARFSRVTYSITVIRCWVLGCTRNLKAQKRAGRSL